MQNPYNSSVPGNCFVGYENFISNIVRNLQNKRSYAIIGGRRCGKTSMLMQIEKDLEKAAEQDPGILPRRFSVNELGDVSPARLFEEIFSLIVRDIDVGHFEFEDYEPGYEYQTFQKNLDKAFDALKHQYGPDWKVILLIDELDAAVSKLPNDQFFQNLRNLDMESRFNRHFRLIVTGVKDMADLILAGSPLNQLSNEFLRVLTVEETKELVQKGFSPDSAYDLSSLYKLTGGHPYLLQGILEIMWDKKEEEWSKQKLRKAGKTFLKKHRDFKRWLDTFSPCEKAVYKCLAEALQGEANIGYIRSKTDPLLHPEIEDALQVLSYHGLIDDRDEDYPEIAGTLFKEWFLANCPVQPTQQNETSVPIEHAGEKFTSSPPNIIVSPNIKIHLEQTQNQGWSADDISKMLEIFKAMKEEVSSLPIDKGSQLDINHNIDKAMLELEKPESVSPESASNEQSKKSKIISILRKTGEIIKEAGGTAKSFSSFIDNAKQLGAYLGEYGDWLNIL
jgi:hypothetical protein